MKRYLLYLCVLSMLIPALAVAQELEAPFPGALDPQFGSGGKVAIPQENDRNAITPVILPDGKFIVLTGTMGLVRFHKNGSVDTSFGVDGKVTSPNSTITQGTYLLQQPDGKLLASGNDWGGRFAVARFHLDGSVDTSFGTNGMAFASIDGNLGGGSRSLALQSDGKIIQIGSTNSQGRWVIVRYTASGAIDTTFGTEGIVYIKPLPYANHGLRAVVLPDDKIVITGTAKDKFGVSEYGSGSRFAVARLLADGDLDPIFGINGIRITPLPADSAGTSLGTSHTLALQGKNIIVLGQRFALPYGKNETLARYTEHGTIDTSFGKDGFMILPAGQIYFNEVFIQSNGKILIAGVRYYDSSILYGSEMILMRFMANGDLDRSFGEEGISTARFPGGIDGISGLVEHEGNLLVTGGSHNQLKLARFYGGEAPDTTLASQPEQLSQNTQPTFTFSSDDTQAVFECRFNQGIWSACASPYTPSLSDGQYTFEVRSQNSLKYYDRTPPAYAFTVDSTAPDTIIGTHPLAQTIEPSSLFTFTANEAGVRFECQLDTQDWAPCTSPYQTPTLATGVHTFHVRARDAVGLLDASPATYRFEVVRPPSNQPILTVVNPGKQSVTNKRTVHVRAQCTQACIITARGFVTIGQRQRKLQGKRTTGRADTVIRMSLRYSSRTQRLIRKAFSRKKTVRATIVLRTKNRAGTRVHTIKQSYTLRK